MGNPFGSQPEVARDVRLGNADAAGGSRGARYRLGLLAAALRRSSRVSGESNHILRAILDQPGGGTARNRVTLPDDLTPEGDLPLRKLSLSRPGHQPEASLKPRSNVDREFEGVRCLDECLETEQFLSSQLLLTPTRRVHRDRVGTVDADDRQQARQSEIATGDWDPPGDVELC